MTAQHPNQRAATGVPQRLATALDLHQRGRFESAGRLYRDILRDEPRCFDALHLLGVLCKDTGALDEGIDLITRALAVNPGAASAHFNLAMALLQKNESAAALLNLERALTLRPDMADAWLMRGNLLQPAERLADSIESYRRALALRPSFPEAWNNMAAAQRAARALPAAFDSANRALALQPAYPGALNNRGLILLDLRRAGEAIEDFRKALELNPNFADACHNLGTALMQMRRYAAAVEAFSRLVAIAPGFRHAQANLLLAKMSCCDWRGFEQSVAALSESVLRGENAVVPMSFISMADGAELQLRCARTYCAAYFPALSGDRPTAPAAAPRAAAGDKIRVAYLSGDFGEHAVTYLLAGVLERHDRTRFETIGLSWGRQSEGAARRRIESAFSRFVDISDTADADVAKLMHSLGIDIAVDLTGHTLGQRTGVLSRRPAPLQINFLGLPATMGAPYIDYLIADRHLVPAERSVHYAEKLVRLPGCFQPNDDRRDLRGTDRSRREFGLPDAGFVFCSFNRNNKLNPRLFSAWMRILNSVPGSVLWLLATDPQAQFHLRSEARARGVDDSRLIFAAEASYADYLGRYVHAGLFLDTLPFNGGATVSDALSMSVPVLTCSGDAFASRMAGSLLLNIGLPELVTHSLDAYETMAVNLALDSSRLADVRTRLVRHRDGPGLFDTDLYRRRLEAAYEHMWRRHSQGLAPESFDVEP